MFRYNFNTKQIPFHGGDHCFHVVESFFHFVDKSLFVFPEAVKLRQRREQVVPTVAAHRQWHGQRQDQQTVRRKHCPSNSTLIKTILIFVQTLTLTFGNQVVYTT